MLERIYAQFVFEAGAQPHAHIVCQNGRTTPDFFSKIEAADTIDQLFDLGAITDREGHLLLDAMEASALPLSLSGAMNFIARLPFGEALLSRLGREQEAHVAAIGTIQATCREIRRRTSVPTCGSSLPSGRPFGCWSFGGCSWSRARSPGRP